MHVSPPGIGPQALILTAVQRRAAMGYTISIHEQAQAVLVTHLGEFDLSEYRQIRVESTEMMRQSGLNRLLVDATQVPASPRVLDQFAFASEHDQHVPLGVRLAIVVRAEVKPGVQFTEDVSVNRQVDLRLFSDMESAIAWLSR